MKTILRTIALGTLLSIAPATVFADGHQIKYRKAVMKAVGGHMGAMAGIMKGAGNPADFALHSAAMASMAKAARNAFPEGSDFGDTGALEVVWTKPGDFKMALDAFESAATTLAAAGNDMAKAGPAMGALGKSCKSCHETFRERKKK